MEDINDQVKARHEKLPKLSDLGAEIYPYRFDRSHSVTSFLEAFDELEASGEEVSLAGRLVSKRVMGKASFAHVMDRDARLQIFLQRDGMEGENDYKIFKLADLGDWIGVHGRAFTTQKGERSLHVTRYTHLAKCLRPLPSLKEVDGKTFSAFADVEQRYRQRYLDLIVNQHVREVFQKRSRIVSFIRRFLDERDFLEVETPALQPQYGGANAKPFTTHHHALSADLYLRISDELYLKRLIVGGFERVYEIGHNFRNEGIDRSHNPEFTCMEFYASYMDYLQGMDLVEEFYRALVEAATGGSVIEWEGHQLDFGKPFRRAPIAQLIQEKTGIDILEASEQELLECCRKHNVDVDTGANYGQLVDALMSDLVEPELIQPTFVMDYPKAISPLAKRHRQDGERLVERFELMAVGMELGNAFSELNDPVDQRERMENQAKLKAAGDDEATEVDEDYLTALEFGLPPTFGWGMGIDRTVMLLTGEKSIKDVILFPALKPQHE